MRSLLLLAALLGSVSLAPAQSEADAIKKFEKAFRKPRTAETVSTKRDALEALAGFDSGPVAEAIVDAYVRLDGEAEKLRSKRAPILWKGGGSSKLDPLRVQLQPIRDLQDALIDRLRALESDDAIQACARQLLNTVEAVPLSMRLELARSLRHPSIQDLSWLPEAHLATAKPAEAESAILLLRALTPLGSKAAAAIDWVARQLDHADPEVRVQAAHAGARMASPRMIEPLIAMLDSRVEREREAALDALVILTGQHPDDTGHGWKLWLNQEGGPYLRGEVPLSRGKRKQRKPRKAVPADDRTVANQYFGIAQTGRSIAYVFDLSKSMKQPMAGPGRHGGPTRWDRCRDELHQALDRLDPEQTFALIGFANHLQLFSRKMLTASKKNVKRAHKWLDGLQLEYQTNVHDALDLTFLLAGRGAADHYYPTQVDTVFVLSDGWPTTTINQGRVGHDDPPQILHAVDRWNPLGRIAIHTIGLGLRDGGGVQSPRGFLRQLARRNGGTFVEPD